MLVVLRHTTPRFFEAVNINRIKKNDIFRYFDKPDTLYKATKDAVGEYVEKEVYDY